MDRIKSWPLKGVLFDHDPTEGPSEKLRQMAGELIETPLEGLHNFAKKVISVFPAEVAAVAKTGLVESSQLRAPFGMLCKLLEGDKSRVHAIGPTPSLGASSYASGTCSPRLIRLSRTSFSLSLSRYGCRGAGHLSMSGERPITRHFAVERLCDKSFCYRDSSFDINV